MKIAIIGAGLAGLATCWHALQKNNISVTLFDQQGIGGGASGIAAGLCHPYAGMHAKKNRFADQAFPESKRLFCLASSFLNKPVFRKSGILRLALNERQKEDFRVCAEINPDTKWLSAEQCLALVPGIPAEPGLVIEEGVEVYCPDYLEGLWRACASKGAVLVKKQISYLEELQDYDRIVICSGKGATGFAECRTLNLRLIKGQILQFAWPENIPHLSVPLNSKAYIVMHPNNKSCFAGATFEKSFSSPLPDQEIAESLLFPKIHRLYPSLARAKVLSCRAAVRVSTPDHLPLCKQVGKQIWCYTGLGSKGLLYHSFFGKKLIQSMELD